MGTTWDRFISDLTIEQLMSSPVGERLQFAAQTLDKIQENLYALSDKQDELGMTGIKAATVLTFAMLKKLAEGKKPSELNNDDWKDIAKAVSDHAVIADDQLYSVFIFRMYERYIFSSAEAIGNIAPADVTAAIKRLAEELHRKSELLISGQISEVAYTEDCLWISLEAMIKLIASTTLLCGNKELSEMVQALSTYAFEYGRMVLYQKEQQLIGEYLEGQKQLDETLEKKYSQFLAELQEQTLQFRMLIDHAFAEDFRGSYLASIKLALSAGVPESEVLKTTGDIDDFFLD